MYVHVQYNTVLPSTPSIIGCSYISRLPNKFSDCCLHPWKMLPASLEAADACPSGHNVQGFCPKRESNIKQTAGHNLSSQDGNVLHSPYVIHRVPVFFGNDVVTDWLYTTSQLLRLNLWQLVGRTVQEDKSWSICGCRKQGQCSRLTRES